MVLLKNIIALLACIFLLSACEEKAAVGTVNETPVQANQQQLEFLQQENESLKTLLAEESADAAPANTVTPETEPDDLRETLNLTFRIIGAMESKDYDYLESVSSSAVTFDRTTDTFRAQDHESTLLNSVTFRNLEYRFFNKSADNRAEIGIAKVEYGAVEIYFQFTKVDDNWLFDGMITN